MYPKWRGVVISATPLVPASVGGIAVACDFGSTDTDYPAHTMIVAQRTAGGDVMSATMECPAVSSTGASTDVVLTPRHGATLAQIGMTVVADSANTKFGGYVVVAAPTGGAVGVYAVHSTSRSQVRVVCLRLSNLLLDQGQRLCWPWYRPTF
jgi:hypothetical protein